MIIALRNELACRARKWHVRARRGSSLSVWRVIFTSVIVSDDIVKLFEQA